MNAPQRRGRGLHGRTWIVPPAQWNVDHVVADLAAIRQYNPQRCEMEQLTAVILEDPQRHVCVGYKDLAGDEFWVRGCALHPPTMPRTLMCEAAAQLANYYAQKHKLYASPGAFLGLSDVRWRGAVHPGDRLFVMAKLLKIRAAVLTCQFQCAAEQRELLCDGILMGTPLREW